MLVLTRKVGERLLIGPDITITVLQMQGNRVRLGIEAPADVAVLREELRSPSSDEEPRGRAASVSRSA